MIRIITPFEAWNLNGHIHREIELLESRGQQACILRFNSKVMDNIVPRLCSLLTELISDEISDLV